MWWLVPIAVGALVGVAAGVLFWDYIRETVAEWLREHNLKKSRLMDAFISLDKVVSGIRCKLFVKTQKANMQKISETIHTPEEIRESDPDVYERLQKKDCIYQSVMDIL